jgi:hypothetical protein
MIPRTIKLCIAVLAFSTSVAAWANAENSPISETRTENAAQAENDRLSSELTQLEAGLPAKKEELARLHRKWVVAKGRMPTKEELKKFEEKQAKGEVKVEDNPYVNKSPLSTPGRYREAYFKLRNEIRADEERIALLRNQINTVSSVPTPQEKQIQQ